MNILPIVPYSCGKNNYTKTKGRKISSGCSFGNNYGVITPQLDTFIQTKGYPNIKTTHFYRTPKIKRTPKSGKFNIQDYKNLSKTEKEFISENIPNEIKELAMVNVGVGIALKQAFDDKKIATSIKHFPGHGSPTGDTHLGFVDATNTYKEEELIPYMELANLKPTQTVMISHLYNKNIDARFPSSLSYNTIEKFLRIQTDFKGVTITDDLDMGAIRKNYELYEIVPLAINAGENVLLFSNRGNGDDKLAKKINLIIKNELIEGLILPSNILESYKKIIKLKKEII